MDFKIAQFIKNKNGAITIEFVFMITFLLLLFAFMADLVILRSTTGKLDSASYSLVNILRQRTQLYNELAVADITDTDLNQYRQLAARFLYGDKNSKQPIYLVLERWSEAGGVTTKGDVQKCPPYLAIKELSSLSPRSELNNERKIPLFQVTLCIETNSFFNELILNDSTKTGNLIRSSSMAVSR